MQNEVQRAIQIGAERTTSKKRANDAPTVYFLGDDVFLVEIVRSNVQRRTIRFDKHGELCFNRFLRNQPCHRFDCRPIRVELLLKKAQDLGVRQAIMHGIDHKLDVLRPNPLMSKSPRGDHPIDTMIVSSGSVLQISRC